MLSRMVREQEVRTLYTPLELLCLLAHHFAVLAMLPSAFMCSGSPCRNSDPPKDTAWSLSQSPDDGSGIREA